MKEKLDILQRNCTKDIVPCPSSSEEPIHSLQESHAYKSKPTRKCCLVKLIPLSNFLLSISTPITREAPAAFAPSATCQVRRGQQYQLTIRLLLPVKFSPKGACSQDSQQDQQSQDQKQQQWSLALPLLCSKLLQGLSIKTVN